MVGFIGVDPGAGDRTVVCFKADRVIIEDVFTGYRYARPEDNTVQPLRMGKGIYELRPYEEKMIAAHQAKQFEALCRQCGL